MAQKNKSNLLFMQVRDIWPDALRVHFCPKRGWYAVFEQGEKFIAASYPEAVQLLKPLHLRSLAKRLWPNFEQIIEVENKGLFVLHSRDEEEFIGASYSSALQWVKEQIERLERQSPLVGDPTALQLALERQQAGQWRVYSDKHWLFSNYEIVTPAGRVIHVYGETVLTLAYLDGVSRQAAKKFVTDQYGNVYNAERGCVYVDVDELAAAVIAFEKRLEEAKSNGQRKQKGNP